LIDLIGLKFVSDGIEDEFDGISGVNDTLLAQINMQYDGGDSPQFSIDQMAFTDSQELYRSDDGYGRMFLTDPGQSWKAIASTLVFGALRDGDSLSMKPYLMAEMVDYFLGINTITDIKEVLRPYAAKQMIAFPNPAVSVTNFDFTLEASTAARLSIYDEMGRKIRDFDLNNYASGNHTLKWNLTSNTGMPVADGLYFYHLSAGDKNISSGKLLIRR